MTRAVLSLGSNLGDRLDHLRTAVAALGDAVLVVSGVYETPPWGDADQPAYLNAVLLAEDDAATARDWLERARAAERAAGRVRDPQRRFGPRTLDVDVIAVWDDDGEPVLSDDEDLTLPHPRAHLRAFVLLAVGRAGRFLILRCQHMLTPGSRARSTRCSTRRPPPPPRPLGPRRTTPEEPTDDHR